jgi:hypothetical protein
MLRMGAGWNGRSGLPSGSDFPPWPCGKRHPACQPSSPRHAGRGGRNGPS